MMGIKAKEERDRLVIKGGGPGGLKEPADILDCENSGTTMRLLAGLLSAQDFYTILTGDPSLRKRPMGRIIEPLKRMGARIFDPVIIPSACLSLWEQSWRLTI